MKADRFDESRLLERLAGVQPPRRLPRWLSVWGAGERLSLSPAAGLAAAIALLGAGIWIGARLRSEPGPLPQAPVASRSTTSVVEFVLVAPRASQVSVAGDFNGWDPAATPMRPTGADGAWSAAIAVPAGRYTYCFVINGRTWVPDPAAPIAPEDGFGLRSSVLVVQEARSS